MKAVYPSLSYALFIVISIAALSVIMVVMNVFTDNIKRNYAYSQLNYVAEVIRDDIFN
jgi:ABC-type lipoprotein release transport system permease subunit